MISIIICSIKPEVLFKLKKNIENTVGVNFELIIIDNRFQKKGICQVYNEAAKLANFDILCFMHEDILILSNNWGQCLIDLLKKKTIGLVGVSGSVYKSPYPAVWSACDSSLYRINTIQHFKDQGLISTTIVNPSKAKFEEVAVLDGVFLATNKTVFQSHFFDAENFKKFHCYDLDLSLNIAENYKIVVSYEIFLEHFSDGNLDKDWFEDSIKLHRKWRKKLPKQTAIIDREKKMKSDFISCQSFLQQALSFSKSKKVIIIYYLQLILLYWKFNRFAYSKAVFKNVFKFTL